MRTGRIVRALSLWLPAFLLAACSTTSHAYRSSPADSVEEAEDTGGGSLDRAETSEASPAAAPPPAMAMSKRASSYDDAGPRARPAKARAERKLAQASAPGRAPITPTAEPAHGDSSPSNAVQTPVLIYTAQLTMAIFEVVPAQAKIEELSQSLGGFLAQKTNNAITVRIPVPRFHEAIAGIEKIGDVTHRDISAEDVSQEFFDLEVRLKSSRAVRERLEHLLARALKVEDALGIEHELDRVVAEIERLEGRLKFLQSKAQFSTITVNFAARPREVVTKGTFKLPFPWLDDLGLSRLLDLEH